MKLLSALMPLSTLLVALPTHAQTYSLGAVDSGPVDVTSSYKPGCTLYNFNDGTSPFTGGAIETSTVTNQYVSPAGDATPYLSVGPSTSTPATLAVHGINQLSFYWGSIDTYNTISFDGLGTSFSGALFGGGTGGDTRISREITFNFSPSQAAALTGIRVSSSTNAFELDNLIFGAAVPEPTTWALMILVD